MEPGLSDFWGLRFYVKKKAKGLKRILLCQAHITKLGLNTQWNCSFNLPQESNPRREFPEQHLNKYPLGDKGDLARNNPFFVTCLPLETSFGGPLEFLSTYWLGCCRIHKLFKESQMLF